MSISSAAFLLFLAVSVAVYYLTPKRVRYLALLASSVFFYLSYSVRAGAYLLFTIVLTYASSRILGRLWRSERASLSSAGEKKGEVKRRGQRRRRLVLALSLVLNFGTLALLKYLNSWLGLADSMFALFGFEHAFRPLELLVPLGVSFYIFQTSGYLIDVYRGRTEPEHNFLKYTLFASYFPQMIQGPINRYGTLMPLLADGNDFSADNIKNGIQLMIWGMLKKAFVADALSGAVAEIYGNYTSYGGAVIFFGAALYCVQLYCDFSGGTDLVRGASELFGVKMAENFRRPYFARTLDDFWRRWHISLGEWMKDYLFYPLALSGALGRLGRRAKKNFGPSVGKRIVPCIATLVVFLAVGVWQGPGLSNIAYGLWNGGLMSLAMLCEPLFTSAREKLRLDGKRTFHMFQILRTCFLVVIGRYFSRAGSLMQALGMLRRTVTDFTLGDGLLSFGLTASDLVRLGAAAAVLLTVSVLLERGVDIRGALDRKNWFVQFAPLFVSLVLLVAFVYLNGDYVAIEYVYENI